MELRKVIAAVALLEKFALTYQEYKKEHPKTKKSPSDPLFDHVKKNVKGVEPGKKDVMRLEDIKSKAGGDSFDKAKVIKLVQQMAGAITDKDKAVRRGEAARKTFPGEFGETLYKMFTAYV